MKEHVFSSRFTYRADYMPKGGRKFRPVFLTDEIPVAIREVDVIEAPIAYRITSVSAHRSDVKVRSFAGSLWWPVENNRGLVKACDLLTWTRTYWEAASTLLDPMRRTFYLPGPSAGEFFGNLPIRNDKFISTWEEQARKAEWDASRVIFCEGRVLVDAGDPIWYAVLHAPSRGFDLFVGHSNLDRPNVGGYFTPGPDRGVRLTCGRLGRAYGLGKFEAGLRSLEARSEIYCRDKIVATSNHVAAPAAHLCARALAQYLWEIAWRNPDLRKAMPAVANARHPEPPPEVLPYRQMLEQLVSFQDPALKRSISFLVPDAHHILELLNLSERAVLTLEEEVALAHLAGVV